MGENNKPEFAINQASVYVFLEESVTYFIPGFFEKDQTDSHSLSVVFIDSLKNEFKNLPEFVSFQLES